MPSLRASLTEPDVWDPLVAPDGDHVAWLSTRSGRPAVHVGTIQGTNQRILAPEALFGHPAQCYCWAADGDSVWLLQVPEDDRQQTTLCEVTLSNGMLTQIQLGNWSWLHGATESGVIVSDWDRTQAESGDLYRIDPETGSKERLTTHNVRVRNVVVNPDERLAYTVRAPLEEISSSQESTVIRGKNGALTVLDSASDPVAWDGDRLLLAGDTEDHGVGIRADDGGVDWLGSGSPLGFYDNEQVVAIRNGVPVILPSEQTIAWDSELEPAVGGNASGRRAVFLTQGTDDTPSRLVGWDEGNTATIEAPEYTISPADFVAPQSVTYNDSKGENREAWLLLPEVQPASCIVHLYGVIPRRDEFGRKFGRPFQYLREQGYAILTPAHGGERFTERRHNDHAAAADWVGQQPWSDGQVIALGHSSGGYDVLMQAVHHSDSWSAGIAWNGIADLYEFYEVMAKSRDRIVSQLSDDNLERLETLSPARNPTAIEIPLLIIQGEHDWMTQQIREFAHKAKADEIPIEYTEISGLAHWTRDLEQNTQIWEQIEEFLRRLSR